jgi:uncharacterized membrane-anchored protein YitT (DUF2179 family)
MSPSSPPSPPSSPSPGSADAHHDPLRTAPHTRLEDIQGVLTGCLFVALALVMFRHSRLMPGGIAGLSFLVTYVSAWPLGAVLFVLNLPFYIFAYRAMGRAFTIKTFCAVGVLSLYTEVLPPLLAFETLNPVFAAIMGGLLSGTGILILIRHGASLGGLGVMAIYLQKQRRWRAGTVQMLCDCAILALALLVLPPGKVALSILAAAALNLVIAVNHRPDRYFGI